MADPYATQKAQRRAETLAALAAVYVAAKVAVLSQFRLGVIRDALPALWRIRVRETVAEQARSTATLLAASVVTDLGGQLDDFDPARMDAYLDVFAKEFADAWEAETTKALNLIDLQAADLIAAAEKVMDAVVDAAPTNADDVTQRAANFGILEGGKTAGATTKTWVTGTNPRPSHAALNRVTIPIDERFANGLRYPGAPGPPAEVSNCNCELTVGGVE